MKKSFIFIMLIALCISSLFASYYQVDDTEFSLKVGVTKPMAMFFLNKEDNTTIADKFGRFGGFASLSYEKFIREDLMVGGEIGYQFSKIINGQYFTTIPLTAKVSYVPVQNGKFDVNINATAGAALLKYNEDRFFPAPYVSVSVNPVYFITDAWGVGLDVGLLGFCEYHTKSNDSSKSAIASFVPITISVVYRH